MKVLFDTEMDEIICKPAAASEDLPVKPENSLIPDLLIDAVGKEKQGSQDGDFNNNTQEEAMQNALNADHAATMKLETENNLHNGGSVDVDGLAQTKILEDDMMQSEDSDADSDNSEQPNQDATTPAANHGPKPLPEIVIAPPEEEHQKPTQSLEEQLEERPRTLSSPLSSRKHSNVESSDSSSCPDVNHPRPRTLSSPNIKRKHVVGPDGEIIPITPFPNDIDGGLLFGSRPRAISSPSSKRVHVIGGGGGTGKSSPCPDRSYMKQQLVLGSPITKHRLVLGPASPGNSPPHTPRLDKRLHLVECHFPDDLQDPHQLDPEKRPNEIDEADRFFLPTQTDADFNNNVEDTGPKKPRRWAKAFEPKLIGIEEEQDLLAADRRSRSDTIEEELTGLALVVRQEMQNYTRFRCLTQVDKIPSHRMFSKFYTSRPYLYAYTRHLANEGIYRSAGLNVTLRNRRNSSFPDSTKRRSSIFGDSLISRRQSLRRSSLLPDITKFITGSSRQVNEKDSPPTSVCDSVSLNARPSVNGINLDDIKRVQQNYEKNRKKSGLFDMFLCCVSDKSKDIDMESDCQPY